jgi:iron complex outermembrane receptor protein
MISGEAPMGTLRPDSLEYNEVRKASQKEYALFGELGYQITEAWQVTVGARWFKYEVDATTQLAGPLFDTVVFGDPANEIIPFRAESNDVDDDDAIFKFNTSYDISDDILAYLTVSEGYRIGGLNSVPECPDPLPSNVQNVCALPNEILIKPDKTTNYEIGMHSQFGDSLLLNGSIFYIDWDDIQLDTVTANGGLQITTNGTAAESSGIELSSQYYIQQNLWVSATYAYTNAELSKDSPGLVDGVDAFNGDRLPGTPENQAYLAAHYEMSLNDGSQLDFDWSMSYQSNVLTKVGERDFGEKMSGFSLHNVSTTWFKDEWRVSLYADNVFDEFAQTGVRTDRSFIGESGLFQMRRYYQNMARPRQVGLRVIYSFDG